MSDSSNAITFTIVLDSQEMLVRYRPDWISHSEYGLRYGHIEFRSPHQPPRRIPVSETGYLSHYPPMEHVEAFADPQDYARELAHALQHRRQPRDDDDTEADAEPDEQQLSLL